MSCTAVCLLVTQTCFHRSGVELHILGILKEFYRTEVSSDCTPWLVKLSSWVMRADIRVNESKNAKGEMQDGVLPAQEAKGEK